MDEIEKLEAELKEAIKLLEGRDGIYNRIIHNKLRRCLKLVRSLEETNMYDLREFRKQMEKGL